LRLAKRSSSADVSLSAVCALAASCACAVVLVPRTTADAGRRSFKHLPERTAAPAVNPDGQMGKLSPQTLDLFNPQNDETTESSRTEITGST
jgi:hypothetical protein